MPSYNYKCKTCGNGFSQISSIDERNKPLQFPCNECGNFALYIQIGATNISYNGNLKTTNNFNDRLKEIKKNLPENAKGSINDQIR